jgi:hypothetical protein
MRISLPRNAVTRCVNRDAGAHADRQICAANRRVERDLTRAPVVPSITPAATAPVGGNPQNY